MKFGVIGYGSRISTIVNILIKKGTEFTALSDKNTESATARLKNNGIENVKIYNDAEDMLKSEKLDGILIGTRRSSHTEYACLAAKYNLPMFLEKPVCTNEQDLERLRGIMHMNEKCVVSFPLRLSYMFKKVKEIVDSGKLGTIEHIQAYNNVPYARGYYHKWYRDENETGGLWLQKATHDLDYISYLLGDNKPVKICAMKSKQIFKGNEPAGKMCKDCEKADTCPESPQNVSKLGDGYAIGPYCCFAEDTGNEDSGSCIILFENGMHVVYSQDFIVRGEAGKRGARLIGYNGTLEFDWISNKIKVYRHLEPLTEEYTPGAGGGSHFGGDDELADNFINVMLGKDISHSPLSEGIESANLCLKAKKSSEEHIFCDI